MISHIWSCLLKLLLFCTSKVFSANTSVPKHKVYYQESPCTRIINFGEEGGTAERIISPKLHWYPFVKFYQKTHFNCSCSQPAYSKHSSGPIYKVAMKRSLAARIPSLWNEHESANRVNLKSFIEILCEAFLENSLCLPFYVSNELLSINDTDTAKLSHSYTAEKCFCFFLVQPGKKPHCAHWKQSELLQVESACTTTSLLHLQALFIQHIQGTVHSHYLLALVVRITNFEEESGLLTESLL